ncbi:hypothetical protein EI427_01690 [Flammeovirga pectinis]|uniref:Lipocalin-like domain-containing protein n=1 Tax=Flammeovirga pectinis TaxID=2494373 RepID=A0A3Q9FL03_9BACT|nr:hypothetical protein [Flammeovirga pectinis]AZQ60971.1 hypothetical protein EI427_01690 [Flammeovirga pectinis]
MKKSITLIVLFISLLVSNVTLASEPLEDGTGFTGKWHLEVVDYLNEGRTISGDEMFGSAQYQIFDEDGKFIQIGPEGKRKGKYTFDLTQEKLIIDTKVKGSKEQITFQVINKKENTYVLEYISGDTIMLLHFTKKN